MSQRVWGPDKKREQDETNKKDLRRHRRGRERRVWEGSIMVETVR